MKKILWVLAIGVFVGMAWFFIRQNIVTEQTNTVVTESSSSIDHMNASYRIGGRSVKLLDGVASEPAAPGSASMVSTRYFGNDLRTDLDGDGREDVAFIITQSSDGSGTFYYAVAALNTPDGYVGSDAYLLGDRIAPQTTNLSQDPTHAYVVVFNFADRFPGEPMTTKPSLGKSVYLKIDPATRQWGVVLSPQDRDSL